MQVLINIISISCQVCKYTYAHGKIVAAALKHFGKVVTCNIWINIK